MVAVPSFDTVGLGEAELEDRAAGGTRHNPQSTSMSFNDRTADGESHSNPIPLGCVKRMKYTVQVFLTQPDSSVFERNLHDTGIRCRCDAQLPLAILHRTHRFDGIDDQVKQHLLELHAIS